MSHNGLPQNAYRWRVVSARLRAAEGDLDAALALLDEAERVYDGDFSPDVAPVAATRARLWIRRGELALARQWAHDRQLSPDDDPSYLREYEHLTLARLLIAEYRRDGGDIDARARPARPAARRSRGRRTWRPASSRRCCCRRSH